MERACGDLETHASMAPSVKFGMGAVMRHLLVR